MIAISEIQHVHVQGQWKSKMHRMTPDWTWTLNSQKYSLYILNTPLSPKILVRFALQLAVSEIEYVQVAKNWKCTEWPQTEHLTVKSTLFTLILTPEAQSLVFLL